MADAPIPEDVAAFVRRSIPSIWTLELLLFLRRHRETAWTADSLVRELRGSPLIVTETATTLRGAELVAEEPGGALRYRPASETTDAIVASLERLSVERPMALREAIAAAPHHRVQVFADAFRFKRD